MFNKRVGQISVITVFTMGTVAAVLAIGFVLYVTLLMWAELKGVHIGL